MAGLSTFPKRVPYIWNRFSKPFKLKVALILVVRLVIFLFLLTSFLIGRSQKHLYDLAEQSYILEKHHEALSDINKKIYSDPESNDYLLRALIHQALGFRSNAHDDFLKCIEIDADHLEAYYHFSQFLIDSNEYRRAIAAFDIMMERLGSSETKGVLFRLDPLGEMNTEVQSMAVMESEILMNRGTAYEGLNLFEKALEDYNASIFLSKSADKLVNRANLLVKMERKEEAIDDLGIAVKLNPKYGLAWYNLFILDVSVELPGLLKNNKEFGPMLSARAVEAVQNQEYSLAEKLFDQALKLQPDDDLLLTNSARLDLRNGFNKRAIDKLNRAYRLNLDRAEIRYLLGNAYFGRSQYMRAIEHYESFLRLYPNNQNVWFNAAMAYLELKKYQQGCNCLQKARNLGSKRTKSYIEKYCTKE